MAIWIWVNIYSSNDHLPDGTKPLPEPVLEILRLKINTIFPSGQWVEVAHFGGDW